MHAEHPCHLRRLHVFVDNLQHHAQLELSRMVPTICATGLLPFRFCFPFHSVTSFRSAVGLGEGKAAKGFGASSDAHQLARTTLAALAALLGALRSGLGSRAALLAENMALRQQLAVLKRKKPRVSLRTWDKLFWLGLSRVWSRWRESLVLVQPETVVRWHRAGFRFWWWRKSGAGRPTEGAQVCALIVRLANENPALLQRIPKPPLPREGSAPPPRRARP